MPFAELQGACIHYELEGAPDKPVVVLSNSLGADLSMWAEQVEPLRQYFRLLRYDTRGHGESSVPDTAVALADLGLDVLHLLDALSLERVHLCGVSLGGITAMWLGIHAPQRLLSLTLSHTAAKIGSEAVWNERIAAVRRGGMAAIADAVPTRWFTASFQADDSRFAAQQAMLLRCPAKGYAAACAALRDADLRTESEAIRLPTLVVSGMEDPVTPPSDGRATQAAISGAALAIVPGAHLGNIEFPDAYNRVLLEFLQSQQCNEAQK